MLVEEPMTSYASDQDTWEGFKLVGDNLDWKGKPRHQTLDSRGYDFHAFQFMAVKDRINMSHLSDKHDQPLCLSRAFNAESLLPTSDDVKTLEKNLCITFLILDPPISCIWSYYYVFLGYLNKGKSNY